jgi:hypothetical protein
MSDDFDATVTTPHKESTRLGVLLFSFNLITVQQDATYSVYYISVGSSTCFGCSHPSSGAGIAVNIASGTD